MPAKISPEWYPHLFTAIIDFAPIEALFNLRATCKTMRNRIDEILVRHIIMTGFTDDIPTVVCPKGRLPLYDWNTDLRIRKAVRFFELACKPVNETPRIFGELPNVVVVKALQLGPIYHHEVIPLSYVLVVKPGASTDLIPMCLQIITGRVVAPGHIVVRFLSSSQAYQTGLSFRDSIIGAVKAGALFDYIFDEGWFGTTSAYFGRQCADLVLEDLGNLLIEIPDESRTSFFIVNAQRNLRTWSEDQDYVRDDDLNDVAIVPPNEPDSGITTSDATKETLRDLVLKGMRNAEIDIVGKATFEERLERVKFLTFDEYRQELDDDVFYDMIVS